MNRNTCDGGHPMVAVPVASGTRLVCLTCLRSAVAGGSGGLVRGSSMKTFAVNDLILWLERAELDDDPGGIDAAAVPGFDDVFAACERAGVPYTSEGVRSLVRSLSRRTATPLSRVMGLQTTQFAAQVTREKLRGEPAAASA